MLDQLMSELNVLHIAAIAVIAVIGIFVRLIFRGRDSREEFLVKPVNEMHDKLQAIKGVGPEIEKTLNEMGIFRYQQIAEMSEYDINRIAKQLKGLRSRIYREDWLGQARELHDQNINN